VRGSFTLVCALGTSLALAAPAMGQTSPDVKDVKVVGVSAAGQGSARGVSAIAQAASSRAASASREAEGTDRTAQQRVADDPDRDVNKAQPDFALLTLPTTLRLPRGRMAFRLTHRFNDTLDRAGLVGLYGLDSGALIGMELRYGVARGLQVGIYRTSDRTIEFFTQYNLLQQSGRLPFGLSALASSEGTNNFKDSFSPALGLILSREIGTRAAVYVEPIWVNNSNPKPADLVDHNSSFVAGLGLRLRVVGGTYLVGEAAPRLGGYAPGTTHLSFGIEERVGGHLFQLNFSTDQSTTFAQLARGGSQPRRWHLGFNLARKFY
jgi:hypothetical protein